MSKNDFWQVVPYILSILSYIIGKKKNKLRVPKPVALLIDNAEVIEVIIEGIQAAGSMKDKTDEEKREYVRTWAKSELYKLLGDWLPDSTINFLIEHALVRRKAA
jgi:hypothetical protein